MSIKELCTESVEDIRKAVAAGANRVEFCGDLSVGGVTPSSSLVELALAECRDLHVPLMVIIRPRGGSFVFSDGEVDEMVASVNSLREMGVNGVVLGALTACGQIDEQVVKKLLHASVGMSRTFHMAFDSIPAAAQPAAIDWLAAAGFDRILTHGSPHPGPIEDNLEHLSSLVRHAGDRIQLMPGGGVTFANSVVIADALGVREVHGTKIVRF